MKLEETLKRITDRRYKRFYPYAYGEQTIQHAKLIFSKIADAYGIIYQEPKEIEYLIEYMFNPECEYKDKGLLLVGQTGVGKTMLMQMLVDFIYTYPLVYIHNGEKIERRIIQRTSKEITDYYAKEGEIEPIVNNTLLLLIDDLGSEDVVNHYGNKRNIIEDLLFNRCEKKLITFATTNVTKFSEIYGDRTVSRMNSIFHRIAMENQTDYRKR